MASNGNRSMSLTVVMISTAVLSTAVMVHLAGPSILRLASSEVPKIYRSLVSWLTPPYLYFVINGIIISIAASSRFHNSGSDSDTLGSGSGSGFGFGSGSIPEVASPIVVKKQLVAPQVAVVKPEYAVPSDYVASVEMKAECVVSAEQNKEEEEEEFVISRSSWTPKKRESTEIPTEYSFLKVEKPLVSSRLGRRKSLKASPEAGKALGVSRPKRNEALESTWKTITDGRAGPLARHLKKSDTWETHNHATRPSRADDPLPAPPLVRKSETFNERRKAVSKSPSGSASASPLSGARLRKEPSVGQDELNRRVEAFIKKFNEEMRLQRQESFNHYFDMIKRGSH